MINIDNFTEPEDKVYCDKINEDFTYFIQAIPNIEICEDCEEMRTIRLRYSFNNNGSVDWGNIFFELQWMLYHFKERHSELNIDKMLISKLILLPTSHAKDFNVKRGFCIKVKYQSHPSIKAPLSN